MQILDLNGVPVWNGFGAFSGSLGSSRVVSRKVNRQNIGGGDGSIKKGRSFETILDYDATLCPPDLEDCFALGRRRAKIATLMKDSVLRGDILAVFELASLYCGIEQGKGFSKC